MTSTIDSSRPLGPHAPRTVDSRAPELTAQRLADAKISFACRRVPEERMNRLVTSVGPRAGDLLLARLERKRQHPRIELRSGRKASLFPGDEVVLAYGNRYASDQYEALVPDDLRRCGMVASGGVAAEVVARRQGVRPATEIQPLGLIADDSGQPLNLRDFGLEAVPVALHRPPTIAVAGSAMNAGKTTSAANLVRGLRDAGLRVAAAKVTGTGSGGDYWTLLDAGASEVLDFTDAGFASTYRTSLPELIHVANLLVNQLIHNGAEAIVLEVADGIFQQETAALLESSAFGRLVDGYLIAVGDALSAAAAGDWLTRRGLPLLALCGTLTRSPLATREALAATAVPVLSRDDLANPDVARSLAYSADARSASEPRRASEAR